MKLVGAPDLHSSRGFMPRLAIESVGSESVRHSPASCLMGETARRSTAGAPGLDRPLAPPLLRHPLDPCLTHGNSPAVPAYNMDLVKIARRDIDIYDKNNIMK